METQMETQTDPKKVPYLYSPTECAETWSLAPDRDEAIREGIYLAKDHEGERFWISKAEPTDIPDIHIADDIVDSVDDQYGEIIPPEEGLLQEATPDQMKELNEAVNKVVKAWIVKHKLDPQWYTVKKKEKIELGSADWPRLDTAH